MIDVDWLTNWLPNVLCIVFVCFIVKLIGLKFFRFYQLLVVLLTNKPQNNFQHIFNKFNQKIKRNKNFNSLDVIAKQNTTMLLSG